MLGRQRVSVESRIPWLVLSIAFLSAAASLWPLDAVFVIAGTACLIRAAVETRRPGQTAETSAVCTLIALLGVAINVYDFFYPRVGPVNLADTRTIAANNIAVLAVGTTLVLRHRYKFAILLVLLSVVVTGAFSISVLPRPTVDIFHAHVDATNVVLAGGNPYQDLSVPVGLSFPGSKPPMPEATLRGYAYPVATLIWYVAGTALSDDPRWASLAAWLIFLIGAAVLTRNSPNRQVAVAIVAFVALQPGSYLIVETTATEPVTLMYISMSLMMWNRFPRTADTTLGVALASKQYVLLGLPLVILAKGRLRRHRLTTTVAGCAAALFAGCVFGVRPFLDSVLVRPSRLPPLEQSSNLFGFTGALGYPILIPTLWSFIVPVLVLIFVRKRIIGTAELLLGIGLITGSWFWFGPAASWSYWFFVAGVLVLAMLVGGDVSLARGSSNSISAPELQREREVLSTI